MVAQSPASPPLDLRPNYQAARIELPTFHPAQAKLRLLMSRAPKVVARCGRRWGKNVIGESVAVDDATHGRLVGWFAPENKRLSESYNVIVDRLAPIKKSSDKTHGMIRTITGGAVEFWSLEDENAGRSRKYHRIVIDEAGFTKPKTIETWTRSIEPTLLDYGGRALVMSNTNGIDPENFLYELCHEAKHGFVQFHAPTHSNVLLPLIRMGESIEAWQARRSAYFTELRGKVMPLVYQQEYLAEFVDWSGAAFFTRESLLQDGQPVEAPLRCEAVFATLDTASKTGTENDATAVVYWALVRSPVVAVGPGGEVRPHQALVLLDWDIQQIEGALLETWLPNVFRTLEDYAASCHARAGSLGTLIEDKNSGTILIQQAQRRDLPAHAIESQLTSLGKDGRAISVSGYVHRGLVKISRPAYDKVTMYKGTTRNHLLGQVVGFRIGDKAAAKRADDLLDAFVYGIAVGLGNAEGF